MGAEARGGPSLPYHYSHLNNKIKNPYYQHKNSKAEKKIKVCIVKHRNNKAVCIPTVISVIIKLPRNLRNIQRVYTVYILHSTIYNTKFSAFF